MKNDGLHLSSVNIGTIEHLLALSYNYRSARDAIRAVRPRRALPFRKQRSPPAPRRFGGGVASFFGAPSNRCSNRKIELITADPYYAAATELAPAFGVSRRPESRADLWKADIASPPTHSRPRRHRDRVVGHSRGRRPWSAPRPPHALRNSCERPCPDPVGCGRHKPQRRRSAPCFGLGIDIRCCHRRRFGFGVRRRRFGNKCSGLLILRRIRGDRTTPEQEGCDRDYRKSGAAILFLFRYRPNPLEPDLSIKSAAPRFGPYFQGLEIACASTARLSQTDTGSEMTLPKCRGGGATSIPARSGARRHCCQIGSV